MKVWHLAGDAVRGDIGVLEYGGLQQGWQDGLPHPPQGRGSLRVPFRICSLVVDYARKRHAAYFLTSIEASPWSVRQLKICLYLYLIS